MASLHYMGYQIGGLSSILVNADSRNFYVRVFCMFMWSELSWCCKGNLPRCMICLSWAGNWQDRGGPCGGNTLRDRVLIVAEVFGRVL